MKLQLPVNDEYTLEVTFTGLDPAIRPGTHRPASTPTEEVFPAATPSVTTRKSAPATVTTPKPKPAAPAPAAPAAPAPAPVTAIEPTPEPAPEPAPIDNPDGLPLEILALPPKHVDFYNRKLAEYREIYPEEKARDLALSIVQQIAGLT